MAAEKTRSGDIKIVNPMNLAANIALSSLGIAGTIIRGLRSGGYLRSAANKMPTVDHAAERQKWLHLGRYAGEGTHRLFALDQSSNGSVLATEFADRLVDDGQIEDDMVITVLGILSTAEFARRNDSPVSDAVEAVHTDLIDDHHLTSSDYVARQSDGRLRIDDTAIIIPDHQLSRARETVADKLHHGLLHLEDHLPNVVDNHDQFSATEDIRTATILVPSPMLSQPLLGMSLTENDGQNHAYRLDNIAYDPSNSGRRMSWEEVVS